MRLSFVLDSSVSSGRGIDLHVLSSKGGWVGHVSSHRSGLAKNSIPYQSLIMFLPNLNVFKIPQKPISNLIEFQTVTDERIYFHFFR